MKCQPEHIQKPVQVITCHQRSHSCRTNWLATLPAARMRVTFRCEAKISDFFLFSVFAYSLDRPVKLPVTLSKSNFFFFVIVLFIRKNVFILLEIILVSCHETIDRYINAKKMSFQNNLWLQTDTRFTLDEAFCI